MEAQGSGPIARAEGQWAMTQAALAARLFEAWAADQIEAPRWDALPEVERNRWLAAARVALVLTGSRPVHVPSSRRKP